MGEKFTEKETPKSHEKMLVLTSNQENADESSNGILLITYQMEKNWGTQKEHNPGDGFKK